MMSMPGSIHSPIVRDGVMAQVVGQEGIPSAFTRSENERDASLFTGGMYVTTSAAFGPELWPNMARWDAASMDAAFAAVRAPLLAIQTTTRNAELKRAPLKVGDSSPWLDYVKRNGGRVEIIPDTGHFPQIEKPEVVNRLVGDFLQNL